MTKRTWTAEDLSRKVLVIPDWDRGEYHWRDASNRKLCDKRAPKTLERDMTTLYDAIHGGKVMYECPSCKNAVERMAKGWM